MKTKNVCRSFISQYVNFNYNRTMWSTNSHVKNCRWGRKRKKSQNASACAGKQTFTKTLNCKTQIE